MFDYERRFSIDPGPAFNEVRLTPQQGRAARLILDWFSGSDAQYFVLCGYAGTGKTYLVNYIVYRLGLEKGEEVAYVAPTGKAATVLSMMGNPASTVHSLIYQREEELITDENGEVLGVRFLGFKRRDKLASSLRLIIVDETSMVSDEMAKDILSYGIKVLFLGDTAQLPPVEGSNSLLAAPSVELTDIVRMKIDSPIAYLAATARGGGVLPFGKYGDAAIVLSWRRFSVEMRRRMYAECDQIIVGTNRTRARINREARTLLGIPESAVLPMDGEKVICTLNDWTKPLSAKGDFRLVNGTVGQCYRVRTEQDGIGLLDFQADFLPEEDRVRDLPFDMGIFTEGEYQYDYGARAFTLQDGRVVGDLPMRGKVRHEETICRFEFGYAITCHKAQGSEYDYLIVLDESFRFGDAGAAWLYTAVSRAKQKLVVVRMPEDMVRRNRARKALPITE